jgi:hypothetical protein
MHKPVTRDGHNVMQNQPIIRFLQITEYFFKKFT